MKFEKLPSGSYRIKKQYKGKKYSITLDHKPTQKEAMLLLAQMLENGTEKAIAGSFESYAIKYIADCKKRNLSPSTIRGYESIKRNIPEWFMCLMFSEIDNVDVQRLIDEYSENHSPKSVRLLNGFARSVFAKYRDKFTYSIKLPPMIKKAEYEPTTEDIERILEEVKGSRYEIVLKLCTLALRRGEAIAITSDDLDDNNVLTINKDIVLDSDNQYIIKERPKTEASNRRILIPEELADLIRAQEKAFDGNPHTINENLHKIQDKLGIPRFRLHMLRHFSAAYLHKQGFTEQQILSFGGWENGSDVMKKVYRYNLDPKDSQKEIADRLGNLF